MVRFVIISGSVIGLGKSLIVVALDLLYSLHPIYARYPEMLDYMFLNFKEASVIGLFMGVGIEFSSYIVDIIFNKKELNI